MDTEQLMGVENNGEVSLSSSLAGRGGMKLKNERLYHYALQGAISTSDCGL